MKIKIRKLKKWLYDNATEANIKYGDDFCYVFHDDTVVFAHELPEHIEWYKNFCFKKGLKYRDVNDYIICLLHEVGHAQTLIFLNDLYHFVDFNVSKIVETESFTKFGAWLKCQIYFRMPCEQVATDWMIDFINNNIEEVRELESYLYE